MTDLSNTELIPLYRAVQRIWDERADLRGEFDRLDSLGYWNWLMSKGIREYPELLEHLPVPSDDLLVRVTEANADFYLRSGLSDAQHIFRFLEEGGFDPARDRAILDFGCGCGRILRIAARFADACEVHGADPDPELVQWCQDNLKYARCTTLSFKPPSPYRDQQFDALYAFSVFSHLSEPMHRAWLEELHRITRPGGVLVLTVQGRRVMERLACSDMPSVGFPTAEQLGRDMDRIAQDGFGFYPYPTSDQGDVLENVEYASYGMTFILEHYIRRHWLDLFELVALHETPQDWQDYVVLRRL